MLEKFFSYILKYFFFFRRGIKNKYACLNKGAAYTGINNISFKITSYSIA